MSSELLTETATWRRLEWHVAELGGFHLREAFESDPTRGVRLAAEAAGVYLDYSKNLVTDDTLQLLRRLAHERGLEDRIRGHVRNAGGVDAELELAGDIQPTIAFRGDTLLVLEQLTQELPVTTVIRKFLVEDDGCDWLPIKES